jgi:alkylation response protein AidB-like acyl-CoA dehydrogenase
MEFDFNEDQKLFRDASRKFLEAECPATFVRRMMDDENAQDPTFWKKLAELGWTGMLIPETYGGVDGTLTDMIVVAEEIGRSVMPGPFYATAVTGATLLLLAGNEDQRNHYLPKVAEGNHLLTLAVLEPDGALQSESIGSIAERGQGRFILNGEKRFVPDAHVVDTMIVAARTTRGSAPDRGVSLFLVDAKADGLRVEQMASVDMSRRICRVVMDDVVCEEERLLGEVDEAWPHIKRATELTHVPFCCELVGLADKTLEMVVEYLKVRVQFDRPIGVFQALQHRCADLMVGIELGKSLAYYACYASEKNLPDAPVALAMAQAYCSEMAQHTVSDGIQLFGGIGFTWEHDIHLYQRRAISLSLNMGTAEEHRETVAKAFLGG